MFTLFFRLSLPVFDRSNTVYSNLLFGSIVFENFFQFFIPDLPTRKTVTILLLRFGCQKVCFITFIGKLHKRNMESFSLCNGDKTHESWKPLLNTIHAFRGLSECLHNETCNISFVQSASINLNADLLTPESY